MWYDDAEMASVTSDPIVLFTGCEQQGKCVQQMFKEKKKAVLKDLSRTIWAWKIFFLIEKVPQGFSVK